MSYREFQPDVRLSHLVRDYWQVDGYPDIGQQEHRFMPEGLVRLTFYAGSTWRGSLMGSDLELMPSASLEGLTLTPLRAVSVGSTRALGVELYPWGARQLFGWDFSVSTQDLSLKHPLLARALSALLRLSAWAEARQLLEAWLLELLSERGRESGAGIRAAETLYNTLGQVRLGTLAGELGLSARQLERLFAAEVGVNAKTLARLIRFEEVHNRLWRSPNTSLAQLAYELGFADQAHLTREFKMLSSMTPRAFGQFVQLDVARLPTHLLTPNQLAELSISRAGWAGDLTSGRLNAVH
ncbi:helix-turn-helix domain-containing protein [Deinococcus rubellus]|uniref:Helix-turn-helix domain-containing protein n=1 Tax=Deinococcus rubellus TaxID=1889240 RepID=A0ABY5YKU9_9DEIO|nr:helix-turn-helix domain-containing protein [Deinococcus rubellus]UWX65326.1 helix-turn-helix domain-containing protein [Deinococcus rubellus]